jgi:alkaline phosphatase D
MIWTRVRCDLDSVPVSWTVARDPELADVVSSGEATAEAEHDHAVHVDVGGLEPGATYHYVGLLGALGLGVSGQSSVAATPARRSSPCWCRPDRP